jgi:hypothetical protein
LADLTLQVDATGELHSVAGPQPMAEQEGSGVGRNFWGELDNNQSGKVANE